MTIAAASSSSATASNTDPTVTKPSGTADGDFLVAFAWSTPEGPAVGAPSGWALAGETTGPAGYGRVWTRTAAGEPASWTFTGGSSSASHVHVVRVAGSSGALEVAPTWTSTGTGETTHTAPSVSPTGTSSLLLTSFFGIFDSTSATWTAPSGMTELVDVHDARWVASCTDAEVRSAAGATGTRAAVSSVSSSAPYGSIAVAVVVSTTPGAAPAVADLSGVVAGGRIIAAHFAAPAAPGRIVRAAHVTPVVGAGVPSAGLDVLPGYLVVPATVTPTPPTTGGGGGGGGGTGGGGVLLGASGNGAGDGTFAAQLASGAIQVGATWNDSADAQTAQYTIQSGAEWGAWSGPLDLAVGGIFKGSGDSWSAAASGSYDSRWTTCLNTVASAWGGRSKANLFIRFAHELNGSFMTNWSVSSSEVASYVTAFRRFVGLQRSILPGSRVVWPLNDGTSTGFDFRTAYPGDDYVDVIGVDTYNQYPWVNDTASWDAKINSVDSNGTPVGIEAWRQYAQSKGKPICFPEWANCGDTAGGGGGGDSPNYIQWMHDYFTAHAGTGPGQVWYAVLFNQWTQFQVWPTTLQPNSWARYKTIF